MDLQAPNPEMLSPNIGYQHVTNHHELRAIASEVLNAAGDGPSGVISDGGIQGRLIEENTLKSGRMAFLPKTPEADWQIALESFLLRQCRLYLTAVEALRDDCQRGLPEIGPDDLEIERMWFIDQRRDDYQVLHAHIPNLLSGIIYLEMPPCMELSSYPCGILTLIESNPFVVVPGAGDMYIWPAWMLHMVYPFRGEGRRLAMSFNIRHRRLGYDAEVYFAPNYVQVSRNQYYGKGVPPPVPMTKQDDSQTRAGPATGRLHRRR